MRQAMMKGQGPTLSYYDNSEKDEDEDIGDADDAFLQKIATGLGGRSLMDMRSHRSERRFSGLRRQ